MGSEVVELPELSQRRQFDAFYRDQHARLLRVMVLTLDDRDLAIEATDEAMTRAFDRWATVSRHGNPEGWTYRVAMNWAKNRLRRRWREVRDDAADHLVVSSDEHAVSDPAVHRAVSALPPKLRAVVVLRYYLDWSTEQVADALGVPRGTVKSRLHRALSQLSETVERDHEAT